MQKCKYILNNIFRLDLLKSDSFQVDLDII